LRPGGLSEQRPTRKNFPAGSPAHPYRVRRACRGRLSPIAGLDGQELGENLERIAEVSRLAIGLLAKSKPEMIEMVEASKKPGHLVSAMLKGIGGGKEKLKAMLEFVAAGPTRCRIGGSDRVPGDSENFVTGSGSV
jgi:hypothetical protein